MRILNVLDYSPEFGGGMLLHLYTLGRELIRSGHHLFLAFPRNRSWFEKLSSSADPITLPEIRHPVRSAFPSRLLELCTDLSVDLLHMHFSFALPFSLACWPKPWKVPLIYHWHNPPKLLVGRADAHRSLPVCVRRFLAKRAARLADRRAITRHVVISREISTLLVHHGWIDAAKVTQIPNAVPLPPMRNLVPRADGRRGPVIASVANFRPQKDHATLLHAFQILNDQLPLCQLWLVGDGPTRSDCELLAHRLGISERVRFLGTIQDATSIYQMADVFVLATHYEGHSLALLEAMSHGLPVVATRISSIPETIEHAINGLLAEPRNPRDLAHQLMALLTDCRLRSRLGSAARESVCQHYTITHWARRVSGLYESVASTHLLTGRTKPA